MHDCPRAEIRDLLPDYVHDTLDEELRAEVTRHLDGCPGCAAEVALLRGARAALSRAPAVDVERISAAVNAIQPGGRSRRIARDGSRWRATPMRIAASFALLVVGGGTLYLGIQRASPVAASRPTAVASRSQFAQRLDPLVVEPARPTGGRSVIAPTTARAPVVGITFGGGVSDLADSDIQSLIDGLGQVNGVLATEPEPSLPVVGSGRGSR
ncbi:MAG: zf-HC2 domain-containing protein [Gemmatimonadota bacterium]|nr:zf-HC2 domain-containing protein [Gemmatimonadota bacterium]